MRDAQIGLMALMCLTGCAGPGSAGYRSSMPLVRPLEIKARVYVSVPQDGFYESQRYEGSGLATANALSEAAASRFEGVDVGTEVQNDQQARATAKQFKARYVLAPFILHWEDRATAWSGRPDQIAIGIHVLDVESGAVIEATDINATSRTLTVKNAAQPADLLPYVFGVYCDYLVGIKPLPVRPD